MERPWQGLGPTNRSWRSPAGWTQQAGKDSKPSGPEPQGQEGARPAWAHGQEAKATTEEELSHFPRGQVSIPPLGSWWSRWRRAGPAPDPAFISHQGSASHAASVHFSVPLEKGDVPPPLRVPVRGPVESRLRLGRKVAMWQDLWPRALYPQEKARGAATHLAHTPLTPPWQAHTASGQWTERPCSCCLILSLCQCFKKNGQLILELKPGVWFPCGGGQGGTPGPPALLIRNTASRAGSQR